MCYNSNFEKYCVIKMQNLWEWIIVVIKNKKWRTGEASEIKMAQRWAYPNIR